MKIRETIIDLEKDDLVKAVGLYLQQQGFNLVKTRFSSNNEVTCWCNNAKPSENGQKKRRKYQNRGFKKFVNECFGSQNSSGKLWLYDKIRERFPTLTDDRIGYYLAHQGFTDSGIDQILKPTGKRKYVKSGKYSGERSTPVKDFLQDQFKGPNQVTFNYLWNEAKKKFPKLEPKTFKALLSRADILPGVYEVHPGLWQRVAK